MLILILFIQSLFCVQIYCSTGNQAGGKGPNPVDKLTSGKKDPRTQIGYLLLPQEGGSINLGQALEKEGCSGKNTELCPNPVLKHDHRKNSLVNKQKTGNFPSKDASIQNSPVAPPQLCIRKTIIVHDNRTESPPPEEAYEGLSIWTTRNQPNEARTSLAAIDPSSEMPLSQEAIITKINVIKPIMTYPDTWSVGKLRPLANIRNFGNVGAHAFLISDRQSSKQLYGSSGNLFMRLSRHGMLVFEDNGSQLQEKLSILALNNKRMFREDYPSIPWAVGIDRWGEVTAIEGGDAKVEFKLIEDGKPVPLAPMTDTKIKKGDVILVHSKGLKGINAIAKFIQAERKAKKFSRKLVKKVGDSSVEKNGRDFKILIGTFQF